MANSSGHEARMRGLMEAREKDKEDAEKIKRKIAEDNKVSVGKINSKFAASGDVFADQLAQQTVGLVHYDDFKNRRKELEIMELDKVLKEQKAKEEDVKRQKKRKERELLMKKDTKKLSFAMDDEDEDQEEPEPEVKKFKVKKNPMVDTSFLPDREREERERIEREELKRKWMAEQDRIKDETVEITYSYWDGSGHRRTQKCKKGDKISSFLSKVRGEFNELRSVSVSDLIYVKEDLIIPHEYTFYDFIVSKARGKSGPLFSFDVHEDVRLRADAKVEKDESHAGKVCERRWYERNKHIFPASRWEVYDPKKDYGSYKIKDKTQRDYTL